MGHRALLACERPDGRYDLHHSQWGAHEWQLATDRVGAGSPGVDPGPLVTGCTFEEVVADHLDYQRYEALFRVDRSAAVRPYLVCWFGFPETDTDRPRDGAVVSVDPGRPLADGEFLRGWFVGTKAAVGDPVADGRLDPAAGRARLARQVHDRAGRRDLHVSPGASDPGS